MNQIKITLNQQQLQILAAALVELPFRVAAPLIEHINQEIQKNHDAKCDEP